MTALPSELPRARRRRWPWVVLAVAVVVVAAAVIAALVVLRQAPRAASFADATVGQWSTVELGAPARNGDGSAYDVYVKPGSSDNLMIFFGDGGLNFNRETATAPISLATQVFGGGNAFQTHPPFYQANEFGGLLSTDQSNPFRDFTIVYLPTTTGDLGTGDTLATTTSERGQTAVSDFNGYANARTALGWVYDSVDTPSKVLVAGAGTGGLSSAFWLADVGSHYDSAALYQYSDSGFLTAAAFPAVFNAFWHADFATRFGFQPTRNPLEAAVAYNSGMFGNRLTTLVSETLLDKESADLSAQLDDGYYSPQAGSDWNYLMKATLRTFVAGSESPTTAESSAPRARVFVTGFDADSHGETPHILSTGDDFQAAAEDGTTLESWLAASVIDDAATSVGTGLLTQ